jgi:DNA-binding transcriptional ArsR family regulator
MLPPTEQRILQLQSQVLKALSNPKRLQILHELRHGEMTVSELTLATGIRQATVSQHLARMRLGNIVVERRIGNSASYRITDRRVINACDLMRGFLLDQADADSELVRAAVRPIASRR